MRRNEVALHYAEIKHGQTYRLLTSNFPELIPGHVSSDVFGFFGLGSGEFSKAYIEGLPNVQVEYPEGIDFVSALMYWRDKPEYVGFVDARPHHQPMILLAGGETSVFDLPINWNLYTQLGEPKHAEETLLALTRIHCAYPKLEQQVVRLNHFIDYVKMSRRPL